METEAAGALTSGAVLRAVCRFPPGQGKKPVQWPEATWPNERRLIANKNAVVAKKRSMK
jgi:hypothetical protein